MKGFNMPLALYHGMAAAAVAAAAAYEFLLCMAATYKKRHWILMINWHILPPADEIFFSQIERPQRRKRDAGIKSLIMASRGAQIVQPL